MSDKEPRPAFEFLSTWKQGKQPETRNNSIIAIRPYRPQQGGVWVFDDAQHGLVAEPFVGEINDFIEHLVRDLDEPWRGFTLLGSARPFPGAVKLTRVPGGDEAFGGTFYQFEPFADRPGQDVGWLCPALFHYFPQAPAELWVKASK